MDPTPQNPGGKSEWEFLDVGAALNKSGDAIEACCHEVLKTSWSVAPSLLRASGG